MQFTIRDWFWLAIVVGLAVQWRCAESELAAKPSFGTTFIEVDDFLQELKPGKSIEFRRSRDGGFTVRRNSLEDSD